MTTRSTDPDDTVNDQGFTESDRKKKKKKIFFMVLILAIVLVGCSVGARNSRKLDINVDDYSQRRDLQEVTYLDRCVPSESETCVSYYIHSRNSASDQDEYIVTAYSYLQGESRDVWLELRRHGISRRYWHFQNDVTFRSTRAGSIWIITVKIPIDHLNLEFWSYSYPYLWLNVRSSTDNRAVNFRPAPSVNHDVTFSPVTTDWSNIGCDPNRIFNDRQMSWPSSSCQRANRGFFDVGVWYNLRPHSKVAFSEIFNQFSNSPDGWNCAIGRPTPSVARNDYCGGSSFCQDVHQITEHSTVACILHKYCLQSYGSCLPDRRRELQELNSGKENQSESQGTVATNRKLQLGFNLAWGNMEAVQALARLVDEGILHAQEELPLDVVEAIDLFQFHTWNTSKKPVIALNYRKTHLLTD